MRQINGVYTQRFNRRHHRRGHVFQGRFMAIMVEREAYLLELARYIVLNPVRVGMHRKPHTSIAGAAIGPLPGWPLPLTGSGWIGCWDSSPSPRRWRGVAMRRLCKRGSVPRASEITSGSRSIWAASGSLLGNSSGYHKIGTGARYLGLNVGYPSSRLEPMLKRTKIAVPAMAAAYRSGHYSLAVIGHHFGVHYSTASRAVRNAEEKCWCGNTKPDII